MGNTLKAIGSLFSPQKVKAPTPAPVMAMPDPAAPAAKLAARAKIEEKRKRGREGTIYSGASYSNQNLGGTS